MKEELNKIISELYEHSENFEDWKYTEILYCKLDWCKEVFSSSEELEKHLEIITEVQIFIEKLQKFENKKA